MEDIVTSAVQYSTVQYSGLAQSADARPASVSSCTLYLPTAAVVSREHSTAQYSTVLILYSSASAPRPASQPPAGAGVQHSSSVTLTTHYFYPGKYNKGGWGLALDIAGLGEAD